MASRKHPEQRSAAAERPPGQPAAKPTGDEVFSAATSAKGGGGEPEMTPEERAELEELERVTTEAYEQLGWAAERLTERAESAYRSGRTFVRDNPTGILLSSFAIGVVLGALISRK